MNKRYSVYIADHLVAVFDELKDAQDYLQERWWITIATIWDLEKKEPVYTGIRI